MVLSVAEDALIVYELPDKAVQPLMVILPLLTDGGRAVSWPKYFVRRLLWRRGNALIIGRTATVLSRAAYVCACGFFCEKPSNPKCG